MRSGAKSLVDRENCVVGSEKRPKSSKASYKDSIEAQKDISFVGTGKVSSSARSTGAASPYWKRPSCCSGRVSVHLSQRTAHGHQSYPEVQWKHTVRREMHLRFQAFTLDGKDKLSVEVAKDEKLGQGAQGSVYRGILDGLRRPTDCAVKSYQYNEDFLHELENLKNVRSVRGCIEAIGFGYDDGGSGWILFPRYERSLTQLFKTDHSGSSSDVAFLGIETLFEALCALHKANFIHLDVKPSNVVCRQPQGSYREVCWSEYARRGESAGPWSDVFGAGATALEYMIWLVKGPEGVENFRSKRKGEQKANDYSEETAFFDIHDFDRGVSGPSKVVQNHLDELEKHFPVEKVAVIRGMLEVDSSMRLSMKDASTRWKMFKSAMSVQLIMIIAIMHSIISHPQRQHIRGSTCRPGGSEALQHLDFQQITLW